MTLDRLVVGGLRGISRQQTLSFAQPNGTPGSGLTILVGTNNAGKSTTVEALRAVISETDVSFSEGKRNRPYGDEVFIRLEMSDRSFRELRSVRPGSSQTKRTDGSAGADVAVVPSRRSFAPYFADPGHSPGRRWYTRNITLPPQRDPSLPSFNYRLIELEKDEQQRAVFNDLLASILGYVPSWSIDQSDHGESYLKFVWNSAGAGPQSHTSDGLGEGLISLVVILDTLRDAESGSAVVIDEPELSLHPQFQRRLRALLSKRAADRQIIYATHSPYFIDWDDITNGASVSRIHKSEQGTTISTPSREVLERYATMGSGNINNPHLRGLDANEVFFLEGGVVLAEGQEDVVLLP